MWHFGNDGRREEGQRKMEVGRCKGISRQAIKFSK
jgi:hypothetical protein